MWYMMKQEQYTLAIKKIKQKNFDDGKVENEKCYIGRAVNRWERRNWKVNASTFY